MCNKLITLGVVSDTHLKNGDLRFFDLVEKYFKNCSTILHAGDIIDVNIFEGIDKEIIAVSGNMDFCSSLPVKRIIEFEKVKIGLTHAYGPPQDLEKRVLKEFSQVHCVVFGHSHKPMMTTIDGVLLFNPGSPFDNRYGTKPTIGFLDIIDGKITGRIEEIT